MRCQAIASSTGDQCKKNSIPGSYYCVHHHPKLPILIAFGIGIFTSLIVPKIWDAFFPPRILQEIQDNAKPIPQIAKDVRAMRGSVHSSSIKVKLNFMVNETTSNDRNGYVSGSRDKAFLHTKSGEILAYIGNTGSTAIVRVEKKYSFSFMATLPPEKNLYRENADEFLEASEIVVPLGHFVKIMEKELSPRGVCTLLEGNIDFFVNNSLVETRTKKPNARVDRNSKLRFVLR